MQLPIPFGYIANLLQCAAPSCLLVFSYKQIQHTACVSPCKGYSTMCWDHVPCSGPQSLALPVALGCNTLHLPDYPLTPHTGWFRLPGVGCEPACVLTVGLDTILSDPAPSSCFPPVLPDGPFRADLGLHGWTCCQALVCRNSSFGLVAQLIL